MRIGAMSFSLSPALSREIPPLLNPLPQAGEEANEKGNFQFRRERGIEVSLREFYDSVHAADFFTRLTWAAAGSLT